ncbi:hypothetical protein GCM10009687_26250 [Asanoa iriomotensis]|uniref:Lipoprotein n=1 Tax=Asanoa iriomotensis TaxID=234613 RepID=A0ABQ4CEY4_9ACTN|nr:hypothetical protein Air01nite_71260 [Asanoa iriomotensis]
MVALTVSAVVIVGCDSPESPGPPGATGTAAPVACDTAARHFSEWEQTAPRVEAEVARATPDEMAEFTMAADEFLRQTADYPGDPALTLTVMIGDYRAYLDMTRPAGRSPDLTHATAESANKVRTSFAAFAAASGCGPG